jgi:2-polyprenyl-6-methoxyphenol hydroxylase-like FAD-dependent oxidoreductase
VLIAGAGIGGLSAAIACRRAGLEVTVLEKSPEIAAVGAGVGLWVDGMMALRSLGLADEVREAGSNYGVVQFRNDGGRVLARLPVGEIAGRYGAPAPVMIRRGELLRILSGAAGDGTVRTGSEVVGFEQDADGVTVRLAGGGEERGAVLVGADGLESAVRRALVGDVERRYAGYQYLRVLTQAGEDYVPANVFTMTVGRGDRIGLSHTGGGWRYLFGVLVVPQGTQDPPDGPKADLRRRFAGFPEPIPRLIEESPEEAIFRTDIFDIKTLPTWGEGRVTMLGDAAHGMTPNMGRGAGEAIQDAVALGGALGASGGSGLPAALRSYEERRREATNEVHTASWRSGKLMSVKPAPLRFVRDLLMARVIGPQMMKGLEAELKRL